MSAKRSSVLPISVADADDLSERLSWCSGNVRVKPLSGSGFIESATILFELPELLYIESQFLCDLEMEFAGDPGRVNVYLPVSGFLETTSNCQIIVSDETKGTIENGRGLKKHVFRSGRHHRILAMNRDRLIQNLSAHIDRPIVDTLHFDPVFDIEAIPGALMNALALAFHQGCVASDLISRSPILAANLSEAVTEVLLAYMPHNYSHCYREPAPSGASWQAKHAINYMQANAGKPLTVHEIANACGVSVRTLYTTFSQQLGTSPKLYLRSLRLSGARRDILEEGSTRSIAAIARRWGFLSLSLFARQYRLAYGELPLQSRKGIRDT